MFAKAKRARSSYMPTRSHAPTTMKTTGEDIEHEISYRKGSTAFNVEQIEGLPEIYYAKAAPTRDPIARIDASCHVPFQFKRRAPQAAA